MIYLDYLWGGQEDPKDNVPQMSGQVSKWLQTSFMHLPRWCSNHSWNCETITGTSMDDL